MNLTPLQWGSSLGSQLGSSTSLLGCFQRTTECTHSGVLWVIVLIELVTFWIAQFDEWKKGGWKYVSILGGIHFTTKHDQLCGSSFGYATPYVDFGWALMLIFKSS